MPRNISQWSDAMRHQDKQAYRQGGAEAQPSRHAYG